MKTLRLGTPEEAGFNSARLQWTNQVLERWTQERRVPGAVLAIGRRGMLLEPRAFGHASLQPYETDLSPDAIYDLASVTKVVATTTCALILIDRGYMRLDDTVRTFIPEFSHEGVTIRHLLTHTSGLPAWRPLYQNAATPEAMFSALLEVPLEYETGSHVVYSCLGYILLGKIIERLCNQPLNEVATQHVFQPLGMHDTMYLPDSDRCQRAVPTEMNRVTGHYLQGIVHDENARHLGGVSGNAGLFSTADNLAVFCQMLLNQGTYGNTRILSPAIVELATTDHTAHLDDSRGLGWVVKGTRRYSSAGDLFSARSFGHTGFTGTSLWIDPERELFLVLLTNGVHPVRGSGQHIRLRPLVANTVASAIES